jgi:hypothetical protein
MTTYEVCLTLVGKKLVSVKETPLGMPTLSWRGVYASTLQIEDERVAVEEGAGAIESRGKTTNYPRGMSIDIRGADPRWFPSARL